jgi:16S rRNA (cytosine1402-N4)-methyltransferase
MSADGDTAADLVNQKTETELADIIYNYGEEKASRKIARAIVDQRKTRKFTRTLELADLIKRLIPKNDETHPATKTFQALRIAVNDELGELERGLQASEQLLAPHGRLAVVTFHSLEDRIVKNFLREGAGRVPAGSRHRPMAVLPKPSTFKLLSMKAIAPTREETQRNPRSRSAKLRVAERLEDSHAA